MYSYHLFYLDKPKNNTTILPTTSEKLENSTHAQPVRHIEKGLPQSLQIVIGIAGIFSFVFLLCMIFIVRRICIKKREKFQIKFDLQYELKMKEIEKLSSQRYVE